MTISQKEIDDRIAASRRRKHEAHERDLAKREAEREAERYAREVGRYPEYNGKLIGFVVVTAKGLYKPLIGRPFNSPGDNDSVVNVVGGEQPARETLEQALALLATERHNLVLIMEKPVPPRGIMQHWLAPMLAAQGEQHAG